MFQAADDNAVDVFRTKLELSGGLAALGVDLGTHKVGVESALVSQPLDVLRSVRVDVLEHAGKLIIETLDEGRNAARNLEDLARGDGGELLVILPLLSALGDHNLLVVLEDFQETGDLLLGSLPVLLRHLRAAARCEVETGGDKGEENTNALVVADRDIDQLLHDLDLLKTVGVLPATRLDY